MKMVLTILLGVALGAIIVLACIRMVTSWWSS